MAARLLSSLLLMTSALLAVFDSKVEVIELAAVLVNMTLTAGIKVFPFSVVSHVSKLHFFAPMLFALIGGDTSRTSATSPS